MTIQELIETLEEIKEGVDENAEVRFASQPSWPFEYSIRGVHALNKDERRALAYENGDYHDGFDDEELEEQDDVVYLEEGCQLGYLPGEAKQLLNW